MEEAPENGKELSHSAHANGMNECETIYYITTHKYSYYCTLNNHTRFLLIPYTAKA